MKHICSITDDGVTSVWKVESIWQACVNLPTQERAVETLIPLLNKIAWWEHSKPSAWDCVLHARRMLDVDMSFPIVLDNKGRLLDGGHRLAKAWLTGMDTIKCYQILNMPEPISKY